MIHTTDETPRTTITDVHPGNAVQRDDGLWRIDVGFYITPPIGGPRHATVELLATTEAGANALVVYWVAQNSE